MRDTFSTLHPILNFIYFCGVIIITMFSMHPILLAISIAGGIIYSLYLRGVAALKFALFLLPVFLLVALLNPLFNHTGATILFELKGNSITLESIVYGFFASVAFAAVIIWFFCYNVVMTSDKFIYLFGKIIPSLSLILSMVFRFVPRYRQQINVITNAQKGIGRDPACGKLLTRVKNGISILSILTSWSLESAIDTADSMKSRGYGLKGRTSYSLYRFDTRDTAMLSIMLILLSVTLVGILSGQCRASYLPIITINSTTALSLLIYIAHGLFCLFPMLINIKEDIKWRHLK